MSEPPMPPDASSILERLPFAQPREVVLCLSGGGFRATFFHLGAIAYLRDTGLLKRVRHIFSVSGGSIAAAHVVANWQEYADGQFVDVRFREVTRELGLFGPRDVRGRIVRRRILALGVLPYLGATRTLEKEYSRLFKARSFGDIVPDAPRLHILATNFRTGDTVAFNQDGLTLLQDGGDAVHLPTTSYPLALAVTASSAIPTLFKPVRLRRSDLGASRRELPLTESLTDGGVFDNNATSYMNSLVPLDQSDRVVVVSDAGAYFDWASHRNRWGILSRAARASEIQGRRARDLEAAVTGGDVMTLKLGEVVPAFAHDPLHQAQDQDAQRRLRFLRTDLDAFTVRQIRALVRHGYEVARRHFEDRYPWTAVAVLSDPVSDIWPTAPTPQETIYMAAINAIRGLESVHDLAVRGEQLTQDLRGQPPSDEVKEVVQERARQEAARRQELLRLRRDIDDGATRKLRLWSGRDPASWFLLVPFLAIILVGYPFDCHLG
jgi:predicted acylesterase/phospholipase RssA